MDKIYIKGQVFPKSINVELSNSRIIKFPHDEMTKDVFIGININKSIITVECALEKFEVQDISAIYKRAYELTNTILNILSFENGFGLSFILESYEINDGNSIPIQIIQKDLPKHVTVFNSEKQRLKVFDFILINYAIGKALNDLIESIRIPNVAPINCTRAMETIRNFMSKDLETKEEKWEYMRHELGLEETYIKYITESSRASRHGEMNFINAEKLKEIISRSWMIMNKFLEYSIKK